MGKQKQGRIGRVKVNPEFKNLVRRLKRPPLTTGWHCNNVLATPGEWVALWEVQSDHIRLEAHAGTWWWHASDPAYKLWTKYNQQYKAWCKIK